jgi:hypothetical protein
MFRRPKPPLQWPGGSVGFLDPWPSSSDRVLRVVMRVHRSERGSARQSSSSIDDFMAAGVLAMLAGAGLIIPWFLFVS